MRTLLLVSLCALAPATLLPQGRSDTITAEDILRVNGKGGTAYDAVRSLKPRWLTKRETAMGVNADRTVAGAPTASGPHVYVDERDMGDVEYLRTIPAEQVMEMRYLTANQAGSRYGPTSQPGIVVILKKLED